MSDFKMETKLIQIGEKIRISAHMKPAHTIREAWGKAEWIASKTFMPTNGFLRGVEGAERWTYTIHSEFIGMEGKKEGQSQAIATYVFDFWVENPIED